MKDIDYIIGLDDRSLEALANDESVQVPHDLSSRVSEALVAAASVQNECTDSVTVPRNHRYALSAVFSLVCAVAVFAVLHFRTYGQPEDTFDDPYLAYAAFEEAFGRVSGKIDDCARISSAADHALELTSETINRIKISE